MSSIPFDLTSSLNLFVNVLLIPHHSTLNFSSSSFSILMASVKKWKFFSFFSLATAHIIGGLLGFSFDGVKKSQSTKLVMTSTLFLS